MEEAWSCQGDDLEREAENYSGFQELQLHESDQQINGDIGTQDK